MPSSALLQRVAAFVRPDGLIAPEALTVVGVSGGVDSMVLLDVLARLDLLLLAAHVNYGLRGAASDADEALVRERTAALGVPLETARYETKEIARERGQSVQEAARELRYGFFAEIAAGEGATTVAVAHHADDQAETLLLNLFRGTGIHGLAAMPMSRALSPGSAIRLVRPFLHVRRAEILAYAQEQNIPWREDAGNDADDYVRTVIRHRLMPAAIDAFDEDVPVRLARSAGFVRDYLDEVLDPALRDTFATCTAGSEGARTLLLDPLTSLQPTWRTRLILEALARWIPDAPRTAAVAEAIEMLCRARVGRRVEVGGGAIWRERDGIYFEGSRESIEGSRDGGIEEIESDATYSVSGGTLTVTEGGVPADLHTDDPFVAVLDAEAAVPPLRVRPWRPADAFRPLGMEGHKNVSDMLTDARVPAHERKAALVVEAGNEIVWLIGIRISQDARVTEATERVVKLTFRPDSPESPGPLIAGAPAPRDA